MQLRAENIIKKYRSRTVVKGVSVVVDQGEIVGLLGPNGAGKTTSFYMMVGLVKPPSICATKIHRPQVKQITTRAHQEQETRLDSTIQHRASGTSFSTQ